MKDVDELGPLDFADHLVWEFVNDYETELPHEAFVRPVQEIPVESAESRLIGTKLTLADGRRVFAILGNVDLQDPEQTGHFLTVAVFDETGRRFDLARYHDTDFDARGPVAFAQFLRSDTESVFPVQYDISDIATGNPNSLRGSIPAVPKSRLSLDELIQLALR